MLVRACGVFYIVNMTSFIIRLMEQARNMVKLSRIITESINSKQSEVGECEVYMEVL
jgi:hypothetical protein